MNQTFNSFPNYQIKILTSKISLLSLANEFGSPTPLPLRRTFSLLRQIGFTSAIIEESVWPNDVCNINTCGHRFQSCKQYADCLKEYYGCELQKKECYKIAFFKTNIKDVSDIHNAQDRDLIAFCIVQRDTGNVNPKLTPCDNAILTPS